jgi:hypothetical protein
MRVRARCSVIVVAVLALLQVSAAPGARTAHEVPRPSRVERGTITMTVDGVDRALVSSARDDAGVSSRAEPRPLGAAPAGVTTVEPAGAHAGDVVTAPASIARRDTPAQERAPPPSH